MSFLQYKLVCFKYPALAGYIAECYRLNRPTTLIDLIFMLEVSTKFEKGH